MRKFLILFLVISFFNSCKKQPDILQTSTDEAIIGGTDFCRAFCCGGTFVVIDGIRFRVFDRTLSNRVLRQMESIEKNPVTVTWSPNSDGCPDEILIYNISD